jgi:multidrug transporter EmrE-like cation transporter
MFMACLLLVGSVLFNVASYAIYKAITGMVPSVWWPMFAFGLALGGINTFLFARSLKIIPLSVAYPVFSGACFALIALVSAMVFGERLSAGNVIGVGLVLAGIILVAR